MGSPTFLGNVLFVVPQTEGRHSTERLVSHSGVGAHLTELSSAFTHGQIYRSAALSAAQIQLPPAILCFERGSANLHRKKQTAQTRNPRRLDTGI